MDIKQALVLSLISLSITEISAITRIKLERNADSNEIKDSGMLAADTETSIPLKNYKNLFYTGYISVGTPPQTIKVEFDTGSTVSWVPVPSCMLAGSCPVFNSTASSTFKDSGRYQYLGYYIGFVYGNWTHDLISIGNKTVNQGLVAATIVRDIPCTAVNGLIGLAFKSLSFQTNEALIDNLFKQQPIHEQVFAFYLSEDSSNGSELLIGGTDPDHYTGNISYVKLVDESYWKIHIDKINGKTCQSNCNAFVDSGTSFIIVPESEIKNVTKGINITGTYRGMHTVDCDHKLSQPDVTLRIGNVDYTLEPQDYIEDYSNKLCAIVFVGHDFKGAIKQETLWILGDVFMRKFYTIYDYGNKRIGLARSSMSKFSSPSTLTSTATFKPTSKTSEHSFPPSSTSSSADNSASTFIPPQSYFFKLTSILLIICYSI